MIHGNILLLMKIFNIDFDSFLLISPAGLPGRSESLTGSSGNSVGAAEVCVGPVALSVVSLIFSELD